MTIIDNRNYWQQEPWQCCRLPSGHPVDGPHFPVWSLWCTGCSRELRQTLIQTRINYMNRNLEQLTQLALWKLLFIIYINNYLCKSISWTWGPLTRSITSDWMILIWIALYKNSLSHTRIRSRYEVYLIHNYEQRHNNLSNTTNKQCIKKHITLKVCKMGATMNRPTFFFLLFGQRDLDCLLNIIPDRLNNLASNNLKYK